ncbi:unnamed protein product [Adineta steineri]|uniref:Rieske domain-containing protein n=1 Tax=Adineta steineri TaxID=433720 RepID=A0A814F257_9BILA|nr:unnamed protein product [Adineta steineri]
MHAYRLVTIIQRIGSVSSSRFYSTTFATSKRFMATKSTNDSVPRIDDKDGTYSSGCTLSYWLDSLERPKFPKLTENKTCDYVVVGAGIAGITSAYCLAEHDPSKQIILIDDGEICSGETGRTTAHLQIEYDDHYYSIAHMFGDETARLVCQSNHQAVDFIENLVKKENIDCEFERLPGYLIPAKDSHIKDVIEKEFKASSKAGMTVELLDSDTKKPKYPVDYPTSHWLRFPNQGQFHPLKYLYALTQILTKKFKNVQIFTNSHVLDINDDNKEDGTGEVYVVTSDNKRIDCKKMILATYMPINDRVTMVTKMAECRTYAMAFEVEKGAIERALYWDTDEPYNYYRLTTDDKSNSSKELLIVGGKDNLVGHELTSYEETFASLESLARAKFPIAGKLRYRWSGQVVEPIDALPFLGLNPGNKNIYIITGDSGTGMTNGTIGALLCRDLVFGLDNPCAKIYEPSRQMTKNPFGYIKHNIEAGASLFDYVTGSSCPADIEDLKPGEGCIHREGLHKLAVYKDTDGTVYKFSAVCPHLKALVRYNPLEKTFDCPFHGSRFDRYGKVINGPTKHHLSDSNCEVIPPGSTSSK